MNVNEQLEEACKNNNRDEALKLIQQGVDPDYG